MSQTRFLNQSDVADDGYAVLSIPCDKPGPGPLSIELFDQQSDYPAAMVEGLGKTGYLEDGETPNDFYRIPLGITHTVKADEEPPREVGLRHLKPVRFANPEGTELAALRDGGRLYVFINGQLWREIAVSGGGDTFRDINLTRYQGQNQRPINGGMEAEPGVITVPYRMNGNPTLVQVAYSETPWSWALIERLGGLADDDPRYLPDLPVYQDYQWHRHHVDHELRMQRTTQLNLLALRDDFAPEQIRQSHLLVAGTVEQHYNQCPIDQPPPIPGLCPLDVEERLTIAALPDPLGVAMDRIAEIQLDLAELKQHVEDVDSNEFAHCAVYAHHLFFNEALHDKSWQVHNHNDLLRRYREHTYTDQSESAQALRKAATRLSEEAIKDTLRTEQRQQLRDRIRANQQVLANWMRGRDSHGADARQHFSQFVSLNQALLDYAWLPVPTQRDILANAAHFSAENSTEYNYADYSALWVRLSDLLDGADNDPALYDTGFSIQDNGAPEFGTDPMDAAITRLLENTEDPLHKALFPSAEQVADEQPHEADPAQVHHPAQSSEFRPSAFAAIAGGLPALEYLRKSQALTESIMGSLLFRFQKQWMQASAETQTRQLTLFARWSKSTGHPQMADLKVAASQAIPDGYEVVHVDAAQRQLTLEEEQRLRQAESDNSSRPVRVLKPGSSNEFIASSRIHEVTHNRGVLMGTVAGAVEGARQVGFRNLWSREAMQSVLEQARLSGTHEISVQQVIRPTVDDLTREFHDGPSGNRNAALKARAISTANSTLPPAMALLEVFNLSRIANEYQANGGSTKVKSEGLFSLAALTYALLDTSVRLIGAERTVRGLSPLMQNKAMARSLHTLVEGTTQIRGGLEFSNFRLAGAGLALAGGILAVAEGRRQAAAGNRASAAAHGVEALALAGLSLSAAGQAVIKQAAQRTALTRVLAIAGPWGWAFMAVAFAAAVAAARFKLNDLERWAAFGPFGRNPDDRFTQEYAGLDSHAIHQDLLTQVFTPQTRILAENDRGTPMVIVEILAPGLGADDTLEHHLYQLHSRAAQKQDKPPRELLQPIISQPILADNNDPQSRIGQRAWYPRGDANSAITVELQTRLHSATLNDWLPRLAKGDSDPEKQGQEFYTRRQIKDGWHHTERRLPGKYDTLISRNAMSVL